MHGSSVINVKRMSMQSLMDLPSSFQRLSKVFAGRFEGTFSDQKICQGCPHRYERYEAFLALNLTVKCNNLLQSLDQFVKGELLEGDNAYYCEKCGKKRDAVKRMCVK